MGSGKTTVGRRAARMLSWDFVDLDAEVVASSGQPITGIFAQEGEHGFRRRECVTLQTVLDAAPPDRGLIVALGGGTVTDPASLECLKKRAVVVYLETDAEWAWQRVAHSRHRPLVQDHQSFSALLDERRPVYEAAADHVIQVRGRDSDAVADEVVTLALALGGGGS
jgi:shikimate kinase